MLILMILQHFQSPAAFPFFILLIYFLTMPSSAMQWSPGGKKILCSKAGKSKFTWLFLCLCHLLLTHHHHLLYNVKNIMNCFYHTLCNFKHFIFFPLSSPNLFFLLLFLLIDNFSTLFMCF